MREADSYRLRADLSGWLVAVTVVGSLGWLQQVVSQNSVVIVGLAVVRLYIRTLNEYQKLDS